MKHNITETNDGETKRYTMFQKNRILRNLYTGYTIFTHILTEIDI